MILETTETQSSEEPAAVAVVNLLYSGSQTETGSSRGSGAGSTARRRGSNFEDQRRKVLVVDAIAAEKEEPEYSSHCSSSQRRSLRSVESNGEC